MTYCQKCGGMMKLVTGGGCGARGSIRECTSCGQLYQQVTGGIVATHGGETYKPIASLDRAGLIV